MEIKDYLNQFSWSDVGNRIMRCTEIEAQASLNRPKKNILDFLNLISPAAEPLLEKMAIMSNQITQQRFGKTIQLYAPMYLSNECQNICTYCGFSMDNKIKRKTLSNTEIVLEALALKDMGVNHVLLVSGEANKIVFSECNPSFKTLLFKYFNRGPTSISIRI